MLNRFSQLSASERRLSLIVAVLLCAALVMLIAFRCVDSIKSLDDTIASQQMALMEYSRYAALALPVDEAYTTMAKQHSSEWTQEQIHDRLRVEIARLSLRQIPQEGTPIPAVNKAGDLLVDIRSWPVGALDDSGEGYRTYQINFRTEPTSIQNIATFMERLQQSPQALRVDGLELTRQPQSTAVTAAFRVTRTVIGGGSAPQPKVAAAAPEEKPVNPENLARNGDFSAWDSQNAVAPDWIASNATLGVQADLVDGGGNALAVHAQAANAELYQVQRLRAGSTYDIAFVVRTSGPAQIRVVYDATGASVLGNALLVAGVGGYRYHYRFTVPGAAGEEVALRLPSFVIQESGSELVVDDVSLKESGA